MFILSNAVNMWFQKLMRQFFMGIDGVVFNLISSIYDLLISIARTSVLSQADILEMADKIYNLLTVFMVFKVILSLITYVVNPDDFSDKTKGISKLGTNIVISLGLLILTPYIFNYAYRFQTFILEDNTLTNLIFETSESNNDTKDFFNTAGDQIAFMAMVPFFTPNTAIEELQTCVDLRNDDGSIKEECRSAIETVTGSSSMIENYNAGFKYENLGLMFRQDIGIAVNSKKIFVIDYKYIFSTVVGVVIVLLLLTFCMDVALRSIKLAFLQLIAPIPILSYVDPKSGKDGMFKKWYQLCFKTYLSLFIRLIALYFAVYIISKVDNMVDIVDGTVQTNFLIKIFIIIGALMFAKDLPKILEGLGIKLDGGGKFTLNPLRKIENEAMGGKYLKKPNDALGRLGKNIVKSPFTAASTTGKRIVAGAYSAANGRGFMRGARSVDSPFKKALNKKIDEWAPDFAKDRQEARVAKLDAEENMRRDKKMSKLDSNKFKERLNSIDPNYAKLYDEAEAAKLQKFRIESRANRWTSAINNGTITKEQKEMLYKNFGLDGSTPDKAKTEDNILRLLQKEAATASKAYDYALSKKETYGKSSSSARRAAQLEKDFDFYSKIHSSTVIPVYADENNTNESEKSKSTKTNNNVDDDNGLNEYYATKQEWDKRIEKETLKLQELVNNGASEEAVKEQGEKLQKLHEKSKKSAEIDKEIEKDLEEQEEYFNDGWMSQGRANFDDDE